MVVGHFKRNLIDTFGIFCTVLISLDECLFVYSIKHQCDTYLTEAKGRNKVLQNWAQVSFVFSNIFLAKNSFEVNYFDVSASCRYKLKYFNEP